LLLKGLAATIADTVIAERITLAKGGKTLIATLRKNGCYCALVSGGFTLFTEKIAKILGFDENRANILEVHNGCLTGAVQEPILGGQAKVNALNDIAAKRKLSHNDFIAVGDGANDLPMLKTAGTGVALHAKPSVAAAAPICVNHGDLTSLLYLQGYRQSEFSDE
jgi:phosphoserine phosphatase